MTRSSSLIKGSLSHHRGGSVKNNFRYRIYTACLDLDELDELDRGVRLFSLEGRNLFSLRGTDYALQRERSAPSSRAIDDRPLRARVIDLLAAAGSSPLPDRIELVTQLRVIGNVFNPVSFFLGWREDELVSVIAEINNTYDQTYSYVLDARNAVDERDPSRASYATPKRFFVSPFINDDCVYRWTFPRARLVAPGSRFEIRMKISDRRGKGFFAAGLEGERRAFNDAGLVRAFARFPLLPAQILARIHLQALRLRALGLQYRRPLPDAPGRS